MKYLVILSALFFIACQQSREEKIKEKVKQAMNGIENYNPVSFKIDSMHVYVFFSSRRKEIRRLLDSMNRGTIQNDELTRLGWERAFDEKHRALESLLLNELTEQDKDTVGRYYGHTQVLHKYTSGNSSLLDTIFYLDSTLKIVTIEEVGATFK